MDTKTQQCTYSNRLTETIILDVNILHYRLHLYDLTRQEFMQVVWIDRTGFEYHSQFDMKYIQKKILTLFELPVLYHDKCIPYITMLCFKCKIENKYQIRLFDELCLKPKTQLKHYVRNLIKIYHLTRVSIMHDARQA